LEDNFWNMVAKKSPEECWIWMGCKNKQGYGSIRDHKRRRSIGAHRVSWEIHFGPIPDGLDVLHDCPTGDNPSCVNQNHLWLGTDADNVADCIRKGRKVYCRGEQCGGGVLTEAIVREILRLRQTGMTPTQICVAIGGDIKHRTVESVAYRESWKHVSLGDDIS
jgi:hypothetical protein